MPFDMWDAFGVPSTRVPISISTFVSYILPTTVLSFALAVLAITPRSRLARILLWPVLALLVLRAVASVDMGCDKPEGKFFQGLFVVSMYITLLRTLDWTLAKEPLVRHLRPAHSAPSILTDALDLLTNVRGHGWNWAHKTYVPPDARPQHRPAFVACAALSAALHTYLAGLCYQLVLALIRAGQGVDALAVFDRTLPGAVRYPRAGLVTALGGLMAYALMQAAYDLGTLLGVGVLGQDPAQWPPAFDAPWRATSLADLWGRRWHQWDRRVFLFSGGYPLAAVFGRAGVVVGTFVASVVLHDMLMAVADTRSEAWRMWVAFGMMAPGMLAERAFYRVTGKKVGGVAGWVWTMAWILTWKSLMLDGYARALLTGDSIPFHNTLPLRASVERIVTAFDAWLHTL